MLTIPDEKVVELYEKACGYNPTEGGEGPGGIEQNVLSYLHNVGAPRVDHPPHKLAAFFEVDVHNADHIKAAIYECGVLYIGFEVPAYIMNPDNSAQDVWEVKTDGDQSNLGGHAVIIVGYNPTGLKVISWGRQYTMTWDFFKKYTDEAYALIDIDWFDYNKQTSPLGMSLEQLNEAMAQIKKV